MTTLFIAGIDTDIGKTHACGALAKLLIEQGYKVFTQKLVETGCEDGESKDLLTHQSIVGSKFNLGEKNQHSPYTFKLPASPHLSAQLEGAEIDIEYLKAQMNALESQCDHLLVEGAGGLCVPLVGETLLVDFIEQNQLPVVLVTSGRLGSINHTLLSLELCIAKGIDVRAIVYNCYQCEVVEIVDDTRKLLQKYLDEQFSTTLWFELEADSKLIKFGKLGNLLL